MNCRFARFLFPLLFVGCITLSANAQQGHISGSVTDPRGAAVTDTEVQVTNLGTNEKIITRTDKTGLYHTPSLSAGQYQVVVRAAGFAQPESSPLALSNGQSLVFDVHLQVASTQATVTVTAEAGSEVVGYKPEIAGVTGPWGEMALLDTPYSVSSTSAEMLQNVIAGSTDAVLQYSPVVAPSGTTSTEGGFIAPKMRGFTTSEVTRDGVPMRWSWLSTSIEDLDRVEILTGLSGFLYGGANVGGLVNQVQKRPTSESMSDFTAGNFGGEQYFGHIDVGGPIDKNGRFGYRINIFDTDGKTVMKGQTQTRNLMTGAFDWHARKNLLFQFDISHQKQLVHKPSQPVLIWGAKSLPSASTLDNKDPFTGDWTYFHNMTNRYGAKSTWNVNDSLAVRGGYILYFEEHDYNTATFWIDGSNGVYIDSAKSTGQNDENYGGYLYLDKKFKLFKMTHKLTAGLNDSGARYAAPTNYYNWQEFYYPSMTEAKAAGEVTWPTLGTGPSVLDSKIRYTDVLVGDDIVVNNKISVMAGVNRVKIGSYSYNWWNGVQSGSYEKAQYTPTVSAVYKPASRISTYGTYMESLEAGQTVGSGYTNTGKVLAPTTSTQIELGSKADVHNVLLTAALFKIDRANYYDVENSDGTWTRTQNGLQVHKGIEFTATGKLTPDLTIVGGGALLHARVTKTNTALYDNKVPNYVPEQYGSIHGEYRIPRFNAFTMTGGMEFSGREFYQPNLQTFLTMVPRYMAGDIGARYETKVHDRPLSLRIAVTNLSDLHYWAGSNLGAPRTIAFSFTYKPY